MILTRQLPVGLCHLQTEKNAIEGTVRSSRGAPRWAVPLRESPEPQMPRTSVLHNLT